MLIVPRFWPTLIAACGVAVLSGLGTWQLERREEKRALIAEIEARSLGLPITLGELFALPEAEWNFRHVRVDGFFVQEPFARLYVITKDGPGHRYIHVLRANGGGFILVDRGFARLDEKRVAPAQADMVSATGIIRMSEEPGSFTPPPDMAARIFYGRNVAAMAQAIDVAAVPGFVLEAETISPAHEEEWPRPSRSFGEITDNHLQYAIIWFMLALGLVGVWVIYHWRGRSGA